MLLSSNPLAKFAILCFYLDVHAALHSKAIFYFCVLKLLKREAMHHDLLKYTIKKLAFTASSFYVYWLALLFKVLITEEISL